MCFLPLVLSKAVATASSSSSVKKSLRIQYSLNQNLTLLTDVIDGSHIHTHVTD